MLQIVNRRFEFFMNNTLYEEQQLPVSGAVTFSTAEFIEENQAALLRCNFELASAEKLPLYVSGIAGYRLYLDDEYLHCGPEWNTAGILSLDDITLQLSSGKHTLTVMLWNHGLKSAAYREMSKHAFFVLQSPIDSPAAAALSSALGNYEYTLLEGWQLCKFHMSCMAGPRLAVDFRQNQLQWHPAIRLEKEFFEQHGYRFIKRTLPLDFAGDHRNFTLRSCDQNVGHLAKFYEVLDEEAAHYASLLIAGKTLTIPANKQIRILFDLNNYICGRAIFDAERGCGASMEVMLTESLFENSDNWKTCYGKPIKGNRSVIDGKYAVGNGDKFIFDGQKQHCPVLDWDAGRYMVCYIETAAEPLTIKNFRLEQTHSGIKLANPIKFADKKFDSVAEICLNSLQNCMHTTYMDCPHYEQLMYIGDGRLEALINYVTSPDCTLQKKALPTFARSINKAGFTQSRYPTREASFIPGFSLFFINMVHDYAMWCSDKEFVQNLMPACRTVLHGLKKYQQDDGIFNTPDGWNFYDWVPSWERGVPPTGGKPGALFNLHCLKVLQDTAHLEEYLKSPATAAQLRKQAEKLQKMIVQKFFVKEKALFSCDCDHLHYSQHVQAMALLCGLGNRELYEKMFDPALELAQCSIYFSHYLFEAAKLFQDTVHPLEMMEFWFELPDKGFFTTPERSEPSRSDCHAWGGHLLYYFVTALGGVTPAEPGGRVFRFAPGKLAKPLDFSVELKTAEGTISVECCSNNYKVKTTGNITVINQQEKEK